MGLYLALTGAIKDEILNIDELSLELIRVLTAYYPGVLAARYGTEEQTVDESAEPAAILEQVAQNRKCISRGNELDYSKAAALLIDEFRSGRLGELRSRGRKGSIQRMETKKIGTIREELKAAEESMLPCFIREYEGDARTGVQKLVEQARGRMEKLAAERRRTGELKKYEKEYAVYGNICGIDEAGRWTFSPNGGGRRGDPAQGL